MGLAVVLALCVGVGVGLLVGVAVGVKLAVGVGVPMYATFKMQGTWAIMPFSSIT